MKKSLLFLLISLVALSASAAESASSVLARCASTVNAAKAIKATFYYNVDGMKVDCSMTMAKQRFFIDAGATKIWYDGTTQWTLAGDNASLSITDPTEDELLESNPFVILNHYSKSYTCRLLTPENGLKRVELVARSSAMSVRKAVISIDPATNLPEKIIVTLSGGRTAAVVVTKITRTAAVQPATFVYDAKKFPASETIDLR